MGTTDNENLDIQALAVVNAILDLIAASEHRVSAAHIARELGMTPPRAGRYLSSMQALGFIDTLPGERGFSLGWKLIRLGQAALNKVDLTEVAHAEAEQLRNSTQDSVYVAVPYQNGASVVIFLRARASVVLHVPLGTFFAGHASASGRVVMAFAGQAKRDAFVGSKLDPTAYPEAIVDREALLARYQSIRERMYDVAVSSVRNRGELQQYVAGIAAPIFEKEDEIAGTIGILSGFFGVDELRSTEIRGQLQAAANRISRALGGRRWDEWMRQNAEQPAPTKGRTKPTR